MINTGCGKLPMLARTGRLFSRAITKRSGRLAVHVKAVFAEMKGAYGWPRIWRELAARSIRAGNDRVRRMVKLLGLQARSKRRFKAATNSAHYLPVAPNLLAHNFSVDAHDKVWTGDITYIWTDEGLLYLAVVIDLFNRQVVGFAMGERMTRALVMDALRMAWFRRHPVPSQGRGHGLDCLLQSPTAPFDAELCQSHGVRTKMACQPNQPRRMINA